MDPVAFVCRISGTRRCAVARPRTPADASTYAANVERTEEVAVILKSSNVPATIQWYAKVGFDVHGSFPDDEPTWCEVARDGLVVQFLAGETPWEGPPHLTGCLYVHPASVEAVYAEIGGRVECERGVEEREWGARELVLRDPDGYYLTFTESA
jgi:hypothetical protein